MTRTDVDFADQSQRAETAYRTAALNGALAAARADAAFRPGRACADCGDEIDAELASGAEPTSLKPNPDVN